MQLSSKGKTPAARMEIASDSGRKALCPGRALTDRCFWDTDRISQLRKKANFKTFKIPHPMSLIVP